MKEGTLFPNLICFALFSTAASFSCYSCNSLIDPGCDSTYSSRTALEPYAVECHNFSRSPVYQQLNSSTYKPGCLKIIMHREINEDQYGKKRLVELVHVRSCSIALNDSCDLIIPAFEEMNTEVHFCKVCDSTLCNRPSSLRCSTVLSPLVCLTAVLFDVFYVK